MAYIYEIINDINNKSYIGKTEFSIERRFKEHCREAFRKRCEKRPLYSAMRKYGKEHFHVALLEETDFPEEREIYWITLKDTYRNGYNATRGGDGKKYLDHGQIITLYNKLQSLVLVADVLKIHPSTIHNILIEHNIPIKPSTEVLLKQVGKPVSQYSLAGEFITTFPSALSAARALGKVANKSTDRGSASHIAAACKGKRKTAYGYIWQYEENK